MSLNGLDAPDVRQAYSSAQIDPAGWFVLKYANRDSVELLGRGRGGVAEARAAIARYRDISPLYGLIMYRRRKILIKYIPEGTSRLLQARTAVHFQDILQLYSPYETLLEIASSEDLNDTVLSEAFPLHTAHQAAVSLPSNRLQEISEDAEEGGHAPSVAGRPRKTAQRYQERRAEALRTDRIAISSTPSGLASLPRSPIASPNTSTFNRADMSRDDSGISTVSSPSIASTDYAASDMSAVDTESVASTAPGTPTVATTQAKALPTVPSTESVPLATSADASDRKAEVTETHVQMPDAVEAPYEKPTSPPATVRRPMTDDTPSEKAGTASVRLPTGLSSHPVNRGADAQPQNTAPWYRPEDPDDPYGINKLLQPKAKLAPRPVADGAERARRSMTAGVAPVPATYRPLQSPPSKKSLLPPLASDRKPALSRDAAALQGASASSQRLSLKPLSSAMPALVAALPSPPPIPDVPEYTPRPVSRGSIKSLPSHRSTAMSPDKIRLMKAVELRRKKLRKSSPDETTLAAPVLSEVSDVPAVPQLPRSTKPRPSMEPIGKPPGMENAALEIETPRTESDQLLLKRANSSGDNKSDSGIEMGFSRSETLPDVPSGVDLLGRSFDRSILATVPPEAIPGSQPTSSWAPPAPGTVDDGGDLLTEDPSAVAEVSPISPQSAEKLADNVLHPESQVSPIEEVTSLSHTLSLLTGDVSNVPVPLPDEVTKDISVAGLGTIGVEPHIEPQTAAPIEAQLPSQEADPDGSGTATPTQARSDANGDTSSHSSLLEVPDRSARRQNSDLARRRRGIVEPLNLRDDDEEDPALSSEDSDEDEDDELVDMDDVTLEDARSVTVVSKSPATAFFPRRPSATSDTASFGSLSRQASAAESVTIPHDRFVDTPESLTSTPITPSRVPTGMAGSFAFPKRDDRTESLHARDENFDDRLGITRTVSSGISKRIQALAELSTGRDSSPHSPDRASTDWSASSIPSKSRASTYKRHSRKPDLDGSSMANGNQSELTWSTQQDPVTASNSVSVSARIVRSPGHEEAKVSGAQDEQPGKLTDRSSHSRTASQSTIVPTAVAAPQYQPPRPESSASTASVSPARHTAEESQRKSGGRLSMSRFRASQPLSSPDEAPVPLAKVESTGVPSTGAPTAAASVAASDETVLSTSREGTRTSRFLKRMSQLGSKRKPTSTSTLSSGPSSIPEMAATATKEKTIPPAMVVGNLNVQFPDTLLWKRRVLSIDEAGNLTLAVPQAQGHQKAVTRSFPLAAFKQPCIPDLDRQELPNSLLLEFADGGASLQAACEDAAALRHVLTTLRLYWRAWAATGAGP